MITDPDHQHTPTTGTAESPHWNVPHKLDTGQTRTWRISDLILAVLYENNEWHVSHGYNREKHTPFADNNFQRWTVSETTPVATLTPALPQLPVVIRPEQKIDIPPDEEVTVYVGLPGSIKITVGEKPPLDLCSIPCEILSKTWFGTHTSGEPALSLKTKARRNAETIPGKCHTIICPVKIKNTASETLRFERLCLRTTHLSLYQIGEQLWTNQTNVCYFDGSRTSEIHYDQTAPDVAGPDPRLLQLPQTTPGSRGLVMKTFNNIRSLTGWDA